MIAKLGSRSFRLKAGAIVLALAAGVVLGHAPDDDPVDAVAPSVKASPPREVAAPPAPLALTLDTLRRGGAAPVADAFAGRSWLPRPVPAKAAPVAPPPPPPAPVAPPLPFAYIGQWTEEGQATVYYLERGPKLLAVSAGATIDAEYRLEGASGGELAFTYVPLNTRQTIRIGE